jgi:hypothetical protein
MKHVPIPSERISSKNEIIGTFGKNRISMVKENRVTRKGDSNAKRVENRH